MMTFVYFYMTGHTDSRILCVRGKTMLSTYSQCIKKYLTDYYLKKAIEERLLYKVENGIYSDSPSWPEPAVIAFKNSGAVFTMNSTFYYQDLTDVPIIIWELKEKHRGSETKM